MSTADDILDQIDTALHDTTVSPDAMRSKPVVPTHDPGPRMWIAPVGTDMDGDGWQELTGVGAVEITVAAPVLPDELVQSWARFGQRLREAEERRIRAAIEALHALAEALKQVAGGPRDGDCIDTNGAPAPAAKPRKPHDRPAWQSPYGPAPRRRRA